VARGADFARFSGSADGQPVRSGGGRARSNVGKCNSWPSDSPTTRLCRLCTGLTTIFGFPKIRIPSKHDMEGAMSGIEMLGTVLTIALIVLLAWNYFYFRT
jgi:hypothetical protein